LTLELSHAHADEPLPLRGPVSRLRRRWFRRLGRWGAAVNNALFPTPLGRWLHAQLLERLELEVVEVELPAPSARIEWPTIAFLSDLHAGHYMTAEDLERLAGVLAGLRPDLVCLGGDLINHHAEEVELLVPALARLDAPLGIFAVPGNHDYVETGELGDWPARLAAHGVTVLLNRGVRLWHQDASLWLCGVDDLTEGEPRLAEALAGRRSGEAAILLSHHPDLFREASARGVDLQLSGHTHGGQIRILGWSPIHHSRFGWVNGLYSRGASHLYVGRGAGVTALPIRIGTRAEITLIRPRAADGESGAR
jgi:predicted MPP superfamily phosphohydrolase